MKKLILICCFFTISFIVQSQEYNLLIDSGKSYLKAGDYQKAYVEFYKAERLYRNLENESQINPGELYYLLAKSMYMVDSSKTEQVEEYLYKSIVEGDQDAFIMMAFFIPVIKKSHYNVLANIVFKTMGAGELFYGKALICAKISDKDVHNEAFVFLEKALSKNYRNADLYNNKTLVNLNAERYYSLLLNYRIIDTKYNYLLKVYVENRINSWQKRGKFEKSADYTSRVNETTRKNKAMEFGQHYIDSIGMKTYAFDMATNEYDADNETFKIKLSNNKAIYLNIPIDEAPSFDRNFNQVTFHNPKFTLYNDEFELVHLELVNPENKKVYTFDSKEVAAFNSDLITYKFDDILFDELNPFKKSTSNNQMVTKGIDVELEIPVCPSKNPNAFALIIGNEDYLSYQTGLTKEQNVEFAIRDAKIFKEYCMKTIGIPDENILFYTNSGTVAMRQSIIQMNRIIQSMNGQAEVIFYYAGHGYPDATTNEPCLIPVDVNSSSMEYALPMDKIVESFSQFPSKKVILFLDACFTGGGRNTGLMASRGVKIVPKSVPLTGNVVVFSASDETQSALPYQDQKHGLFTYYLLKKIKETNGEATLAELDSYLAKEVSIKAAIVNKQEQTPKTHFSPTVIDSWENWKLK
jgi:tetratricopeptide (TPR) repeat protein